MNKYNIVQLKYRQHQTLKEKEFKEMISRGEQAGKELQRKINLDRAKVFNRHNPLPNE